jgi:Flp pilus assembly protein CpaB
MAQSTYAEREETVNEKVENILQPNMRAMAVRVEDVRLSYELGLV